MSSFNGQFVWLELMTEDPTKATAFYRSVIGWQAADAGHADMPYTIMSAGTVAAAGIMAMPAAARERGARPGWLGFVWTDDVDAAAARVVGAGGATHRPGEDIPGVGRFAVVADPQGAAFVLFRGMETEQAPPPAGATPGRVGWHELHTTDRAAALAFYADQFGWTAAEALDMGPMGVYQMFATDAVPVGGMMNQAPGPTPPHWLYYVNVDDIDAAVARVRQAGGQVVHGPQEVPGGSRIAQCLDDQGTVFAIVAPAA